MRLPWQRRAEPSVDPGHPHPYRSKQGGGLGEVAAIYGGGPNLAGPGAVDRTRGCAVPGCGKMRDDLIHAPAEE